VPVGPAGLEPGSGSVVVETVKAERCSFDAFDEVVDRFGGPLETCA